MRQTHERKPVPKNYASRDRLPNVTPVIGDRVVYETWAGDVLHPVAALAALRGGRSIFYTTWEERAST